ncbi:LysR family transcriptional regulator [Cryobacterium arcticum]|uniref:LysR family transcriptional regulator n=1 Tax=Cryobacterium arcticum TaxID=670052 RepID=A0A318A174_9MICO|nr:LysR family transcriptional regulator [Cryobacterium arcticum]PXA73228.1 LysR family transcriptional regulator [Cryobacterium arcticum]
MDPYRILLLRELEEHGSVAAVARTLGLSPSAVSQQLASLQASVDVPLTRRDGRRLVLTQAGRTLAQAGREIAAALANAKDSLRRYEQDSHGIVRVSAFHSAALSFFRPLISRLDGDGPKLYLVDADVAEAEFPRMTGDHDIVIAHRLPTGDPWPEEMTVVPLLREEVDVAVAANHPLAQEDAIDPAALRDTPWLTFRTGYPMTPLTAVVAHAVGSSLPQAHHINDLTVAATIVASGTAVALMPRRTMGAAALDGVVLRPLKGIVLERQIDALMRPEAIRRTAVQRVLAELQAIAAGL